MKHAPRRLLATFLASAALATTVRAHAQSNTFYLDRAQLSGAPDDGFMVWRPYTYKKTRFYGQYALGYTNRPLRADTVAPNAATTQEISTPVPWQLISYLSAGTEVANRASFNVMLPIAIQKGPSVDPIQQSIGNGLNVRPIAVSDLRLDARVRLLNSNNNKFKLGAGGAMWLPTGNATSFDGDGSLTGGFFVSSEYDFGRFLLAGNIGTQFRPNLSIGGSNGALFIGDELRWAFGGYVPLRQGTVRLGVELWGTTGLQKITDDNGVTHNTIFSTRNTDLEWLGQARFALGKTHHTFVNVGAGTKLATGYGSPDFRILASIGSFFTISDRPPSSTPPGYRNVPDVSDYAKDTDGDGYPDDIDKCPLVKEDGKPPNPTDGCPAPSDRDGDGIPDNIDKCPDTPEDKDGIQDNDGCPETDADNDGIPDTKDHCPLEPGPRSKIAEKNGCPQLTHVTESGEVQLLKPIQFEFAKATIKPVSYPILNEVVTLMKARPNIRIGVYGHTDNKGSHALNMKLSAARAHSVMEYLIHHGISSSRLESQGFGPDKPIASNATAAGRAKNRRVEFKILNEDQDNE